MSETSKFAWVRLNADGVLVAMLAMFMGMDLLEPDRDDLVQHLGYIPAAFYVWSVLFLFGGIAMFLGFFLHTIGWELLGRFAIAAAAVLQATRLAMGFGPTHYETVRWYILAAMVAIAFAIRATALLNRQGLAVVIGGNGELDE